MLYMKIMASVIYNGLKMLEMSHVKHYLQISYAGKDQLYIPVDQLNQT